MRIGHDGECRSAFFACFCTDRFEQRCADAAADGVGIDEHVQQVVDAILQRFERRHAQQPVILGHQHPPGFDQRRRDRERGFR
jgi:hypothetical protein